MYFYELMKSCNTDNATELFLNLCKDTPDREETKNNFLKVYNELAESEPVVSDNQSLLVSKEKDIDGQEYFEVSSIAENDPFRYGLEMVPRKEIIGFKVDEESVNTFGKETFVAAVLWEMTWFGFDEESMLEETSSWEFDDEAEDDH